MTASARRTLRSAMVACALLPLVLALLLVRPAPAGGQSPGVGYHALTYAAAAVEPSGEIGAGGGLLPVDGGAPLVRARVDGAPSTTSIAASVEPGTLWSTIAGVVNTEAGEEVVPTPTRAQAEYPGNGKASASQFGPEEAGPLSVGAGTAVVSAALGQATGRAELGTWRLSAGSSSQARGLALALADLRLRNPDAPRVRAAEEDDPTSLVVSGGRAQGVVNADPAAGALSVRASSAVEEVSVFGQLVLRGLAGSAEAALTGAARAAAARLDIAAARVGDFPVVIGADGVRVRDEGALDAAEAAALSGALNAALEQAGITVRLVPPRRSSGDGYAEADSGGLRVTVTTPSDSGVPANTVGLLLGRVSVTSADEPAAPGPAPGPVQGGQDGGFTPGPFPAGATPPVGGLGGGVTPTPGTAAPEGGRRVLLAGRVIPATVALAAFAVWQLLSLSTATLAAIALKEREEPA